MMNPNEMLREIFKNRTIQNTKTLVKWLFPNLKAAQNITYKQAEIVKKIAFSETKRLSISAYTRYGKSQVVAIAVAIYILINKNKKVKFIGPTDDQAQIIKNYMSELILQSRGNLLLNLSEIEVKTKKERIKAEASSKRMTFKNGCEYRVVTAHGKGFGAMGHGADLIVMDEAAMISRESYAKITRMLGDDPENAQLVELFNPWDRDTKAYDHSISTLFDRIEIDYRVGIKEGRTTEAFIEEMRNDITPLEFTVLYESRFPEQSEDSLFSLAWVTAAEERTYDFDIKLQEKLKEHRDLMAKRSDYPESVFRSKINPIKEELSKYRKIIACDPAELGLDETVMFWGIEYENKFQIIDYFSESKSEPMQVVGKVINIAEDFFNKEIKNSIIIDRIGIGSGPLSRIKEVLKEKNIRGVSVLGAHFGEQATKKDIFQNKKAENYFRLADIMRDDMIDIPKIEKLRTQAMMEKWERTSTNKKIVKDPDKSPDFLDALVFLVWKDKSTLSFAFT